MSRAMKRIAEAIGLLKQAGYVFFHFEYGNALFARDDRSQASFSASVAGTRSEKVLERAR